MKLSKRLAKLQLNKTESRPAPKPAGSKGRKSTRMKWAALVLCLLFAGGGTWAGLAIFVWEKLPAALIGRWEVHEGPSQGNTFEFFRNGDLEIRPNMPGMKVTLHGRAVVQGKTLITTTQPPGGRREETSKSIMRELTPNSLVLEEQGDVLKLVKKH